MESAKVCDGRYLSIALQFILTLLLKTILAWNNFDKSSLRKCRIGNLHFCHWKYQEHSFSMDLPSNNQRNPHTKMAMNTISLFSLGFKARVFLAHAWFYTWVTLSFVHIFRKRKVFEQECIPVGCVPAAHWPYAAVFFPGGGGSLVWGGSPWSRGGGSPWSRGGLLGPGGVFLGPGGFSLVPGGFSLVPGGFPLVQGGSAWSWGVSLVQGGLLGPGGSPWSLGVLLGPGGVLLGPGGCLPGPGGGSPENPPPC